MVSSSSKRNSKRVYNNRLLYTLIVIGILAIIGVAVYADAPVTPIPNPGHYISEIQTCNTTGDILEMVQTGGILNWSCVQAPSAPDLSGYETTSDLTATLGSYAKTSSIPSNIITAPSGCAANQYLQYTGSGWTCASVSSVTKGVALYQCPWDCLSKYGGYTGSCNSLGGVAGLQLGSPTCNTYATLGTYCDTSTPVTLNCPVFGYLVSP